MPFPKSYSYQEYLDLMADSSGIKMQEESSLIIDRFSVSQNIPAGFAPVIFLLDFTTKKYIYVDKACFNLFGYTAAWMMEYGVGEYLKTWHPADYDTINEKVFLDNINFLKTLPKDPMFPVIQLAFLWE